MIAVHFETVIASVSEAIHFAEQRKNGLLRRGAYHRARIRATRWLIAMTAFSLSVAPAMWITVSRSRREFHARFGLLVPPSL
jgi:hypothetical protein